MKLASLLFAERCEQVLLGFTRELAGACEHPLVARCEVERVGAAVARVRAPLYEALGLELVDRGCSAAAPPCSIVFVPRSPAPALELRLAALGL